MKQFIAVAAVLALFTTPALAAMPAPVLRIMGVDFYRNCTAPRADSGAQVVGACAAYVAGIADGLADARKVCIGPGVTAERLLPVALFWIRGHMQNGGLPASAQIMTGLEAEFPCRAPARSGASRPAPQQSVQQNMELGITFFKFLQAALPTLAKMGLL